MSNKMNRKNTNQFRPRSTTCCQINLHKSEICSAEFIEYATAIQNDLNSPLIACLQEPHANAKGKIDLIPDRRLVYQRNMQNAWPRAAIYISANLDTTPISEYIDRDMATVGLANGS